MIHSELVLRVGIMEKRESVTGRFIGSYALGQTEILQGAFRVYRNNSTLIIELVHDGKSYECEGMVFHAMDASSCFILDNVTIGIQFHWQRQEEQKFSQDLVFVRDTDDLITVINKVSLENYLMSVIASEMNAQAPIELLKAHAITSRSWLVSLLTQNLQQAKQTVINKHHDNHTEIIKWYGREDHTLFDVCADDHCQRYHGISRIISDSVYKTIEETRGLFLVSKGEICDARYSKSCGGVSELFQNAWEDIPCDYLTSVRDTEGEKEDIRTDSHEWYTTRPDSYCNTSDPDLLKMILPHFDQETADFYRWSVRYSEEELSLLLKTKSGIDFGQILMIQPVERGPSGRIYRLKIQGTKATVIIGKELEIRKWLSPTHLYSSAFIVQTEKSKTGKEDYFTFIGAGWGHGVGLCQIGAAVMAVEGKKYQQILGHYFKNAQIVKLY